MNEAPVRQVNKKKIHVGLGVCKCSDQIAACTPVPPPPSTRTACLPEQVGLAELRRTAPSHKSERDGLVLMGASRGFQTKKRLVELVDDSTWSMQHPRFCGQFLGNTQAEPANKPAGSSVSLPLLWPTQACGDCATMERNRTAASLLEGQFPGQVWVQKLGPESGPKFRPTSLETDSPSQLFVLKVGAGI
jgi:hypothetical protein